MPHNWQASLELLAVFTGVLYVVLSIRGQRSCWIFGLLSTLAYLVLSALARLHLQSALQGLYAALAIYGWWQWRSGHDGSADLAVTRLDGRQQMLAICALGALTAGGGGLLLHTGSPQPWLEAVTTAGGLVATALATRKVLDNWPWWVGTNVLTAWLYHRAGMAPTVALYVAYAALAMVGWREWRKRLASPSAP
jgi:nicotinamide mononucleotide transporter